MNGSLVVTDRYEDGIHCVTLNRPEKRNALSIELREALADRLHSLGGDPGCRGVVLTGAGTAFCAGMDFAQFGGDRDHRLKLFHSTRNLFSSLLGFPKPLVAAINGVAVGGGFTLALCCDERLACGSAHFGFYEVGRGIPAPYGIVRLFVDAPRARDWCQTGRRIEVTEAVDAGIVKEIVSAERLVDACRSEARRRSPSGREVSAALRSAFGAEMGRFESALFAER